MRSDWYLSALCTVLKKGNPNIGANYRGIGLLSEVLPSILCERLKPHANAPIEPYQCGFRSGKSTHDQIVTICQILEKTHENLDKTYELVVGSFQ